MTSLKLSAIAAGVLFLCFEPACTPEIAVDWTEPKTIANAAVAGVVTVDSISHCEASSCWEQRMSSTHTPLDLELLRWETQCLGESSETITNPHESGSNITKTVGKRYVVVFDAVANWDICQQGPPASILYTGPFSEVRSDNTFLIDHDRSISLDEFMTRCAGAKRIQREAGTYPLPPTDRTCSASTADQDAGAEDGG
jgi:hypothetical protein